jgi:tetratricopeptide (TPR) repeat protein
MDSLKYIDDYFKGLLTGEERSQFERLVESDPLFAEEVAFYVSAFDVIKAETQQETKLRFKALYRERVSADPAPGLVRKIVFSSAAAAAVILIVLAGWLLLRPAGPERLANDYIGRQLKTLPVQMSSEQDSLQQAISVYNEGQFPAALQRFERLLQAHPGNSRALTDAGLTSLRLGNYDKALGYFQLLASDTTLYRNPALFYQSLTLMKRNGSGDAANARQLLRRIVEENLDMKAEAQQLLQKW